MIDLDKDACPQFNGVVLVTKGIDRGRPAADVGIGVKDGDLDGSLVSGGPGELVQEVCRRGAASARADNGYSFGLRFGVRNMRRGLVKGALGIICGGDNG